MNDGGPSDEQLVWLLAPRELLYQDRHENKWRASEIAFRNLPPPPLQNGSTAGEPPDRLRVALPAPGTLRAGPNHYLGQHANGAAVAQFLVADARELRQVVAQDPNGSSPEDGLVIGAKPRGVRLELAARSVILPHPPRGLG